MTLTRQSEFMGADLAISISAERAATIVKLRGDADPAALPVLVDALARVIADNDGAVVIDLRQTEFIDTATVRTIGRAERYLGERGRRLTVRSPSRLAMHVLAFGGLSHLVEAGRAVDA